MSRQWIEIAIRVMMCAVCWMELYTNAHAFNTHNPPTASLPSKWSHSIKRQCCQIWIVLCTALCSILQWISCSTQQSSSSSSSVKLHFFWHRSIWFTRFISLDFLSVAQILSIDSVVFSGVLLVKFNPLCLFTRTSLVTLSIWDKNKSHTPSADTYNSRVSRRSIWIICFNHVSCLWFWLWRNLSEDKSVVVLETQYISFFFVSRDPLSNIETYKCIRVPTLKFCSTVIRDNFEEPINRFLSVLALIGTLFTAPTFRPRPIGVEVSVLHFFSNWSVCSFEYT